MKSMNFGTKGWILLIYQFIAFVAFTVFTNWPMNVLADMYGGSTVLSPIYTVGTIVAIVFQLILSTFIGKLKSIKKLGASFGIIGMVFAMLIMVLLAGTPWLVCYFIVCLFVPMYAVFAVSALVGQWFPTKKGIFMGIATLAFPIVNAMLTT